MVLSEVLNELSTTTLFVERERGDVEFDSIRVFIFLFETQLTVNSEEIPTPCRQQCPRQRRWKTSAHITGGKLLKTSIYHHLHLQLH